METHLGVEGRMESICELLQEADLHRSLSGSDHSRHENKGADRVG